MKCNLPSLQEIRTNLITTSVFDIHFACLTNLCDWPWNTRLPSWKYFGPYYHLLIRMSCFDNIKLIIGKYCPALIILNCSCIIGYLTTQHRLVQRLQLWIEYFFFDGKGTCCTMNNAAFQKHFYLKKSEHRFLLIILNLLLNELMQIDSLAIAWQSNFMHCTVGKAFVNVE